LIGDFVGVTVAVHSSKGGTGKTCIATNIAALLSYKGYNVCLLDMDLKGPSLSALFNLYPKRWFNDYLDDKCDIENIFIDLSPQLKTKGRFIIGSSNPDIVAVRKIFDVNRNWQAKALKLLLDAKKSIFMNGTDILILDTGAGIEFESVNAIAVADLVLSVIIPNKISYFSTEQIVKGVYMMLEKKCYLIENMSSVYNLSENKEILGIPVIVSIPCICDILSNDCTNPVSLTNPNHIFTQSIKKICSTIEEYLYDK
jgi:septum site-determining protein MinD